MGHRKRLSITAKFHYKAATNQDTTKLNPFMRIDGCQLRGFRDISWNILVIIVRYSS